MRCEMAALRRAAGAVLSSYDYRSVDEYQIPRAQWRTHRDEYLYKANLVEQSKSARMLTGLNQRLNTQFQHTNESLSTNPQVYFDTHGGWHLHRYRAEEDVDDGAVRLLYPTARVIALRDVLMQTVGRTYLCFELILSEKPGGRSRAIFE